jgi:hypothetical protein
LPGVGSKLRSRLGQIAPQGVLSDRLKKGLNTILGKSVDMDQILCSDAIYVSFMTFYVLTFGAWRRYYLVSHEDDLVIMATDIWRQQHLGSLCSMFSDSWIRHEMLLRSVIRQLSCLDCDIFRAG